MSTVLLLILICSGQKAGTGLRAEGGRPPSGCCCCFRLAERAGPRTRWELEPPGACVHPRAEHHHLPRRVAIQRRARDVAPLLSPRVDGHAEGGLELVVKPLCAQRHHPHQPRPPAALRRRLRRGRGGGRVGQGAATAVSAEIARPSAAGWPPSFNGGRTYRVLLLLEQRRLACLAAGLGAGHGLGPRQDLGQRVLHQGRLLLGLYCPGGCRVGW